MSESKYTGKNVYKQTARVERELSLRDAHDYDRWLAHRELNYRLEERIFDLEAELDSIQEELL